MYSLLVNVLRLCHGQSVVTHVLRTVKPVLSGTVLKGQLGSTAFLCSFATVSNGPLKRNHSIKTKSNLSHKINPLSSPEIKVSSIFERVLVH